MNTNYNKFSNEAPTGTLPAENPSMQVPIAPQVPLQKPLFTKFFCFSLKTTVLIVSYFHLISSAIAIPVVALLFQKMLSEAKNEEEVLIMNIVMGSVIAVVAVVVIAHALLLGGTYKKKTSLITAYLIIYGIIVGLSIGGSIRNIARGFFTPGQVVELLLSIVIGIFSLMAARAYRTQLLNDRMLALTMQSCALNDPPPYSEA